MIDKQNVQPMQIFTREETTPSEKTLKKIREFAYTYRMKNGLAYCLN
jgi:hypothetical protein